RPGGRWRCWCSSPSFCCCFSTCCCSSARWPEAPLRGGTLGPLGRLAAEPLSGLGDRRAAHGARRSGAGGLLGPVDLAVLEQGLDLRAGQRLIFEQGLGKQVELVLLGLEDIGGARMRAVNQVADLLVDQLAGLVGHHHPLVGAVAEISFALFL